MYGLSCSTTCGILPDQELNPSLAGSFLTTGPAEKSYGLFLKYWTMLPGVSWFSMLLTPRQPDTHTKPLQVWDCLPLTPEASHSVSSSICFSILTAMVWQGQYRPFCSPRNRSTNRISLCRITLTVPVEMCSYLATFYLWSKYNESVMAPCLFISSFFIFFYIFKNSFSLHN